MYEPTENEVEGYEEQEGINAFWTPDSEGERLTGKVTNITEGDYGKQYVIKKDDDEEVLTPSHKVLQARMIDVAVGDSVIIIYAGDEPPSVKGRNPTKIYRVYKK